MEAIYFNKDNIDVLEKNNTFNKFFEEWGIDKFFDSSKVFMWNGKKYKFDRLHTTPCVLMRCVDDNSILSFGVDSDIKNEFGVVE
jgi:hypothetical protein